MYVKPNAMPSVITMGIDTSGNALSSGQDNVSKFMLTVSCSGELWTPIFRG